MESADIMYIKSDNLLQDVQAIIETSQKFAYRTVNIAMVLRNWLLGKRIAEEELQGKERAEYGAEMVQKLSSELTQIYGNGFTKTNLYTFMEFYKTFPKIFHSLSGKSRLNYYLQLFLKLGQKIFHTLCGKSHLNYLLQLSLKLGQKIFHTLCGKCLERFCRIL